MPDHLHVVAEGESDACDLVEFVRRSKQKTAFDWMCTGDRLWQESFHDHILRDSESTRTVVRYVLDNPVNAPLVASPEDYAYSGSFVYEYGELIEWAFGWNRED